MPNALYVPSVLIFAAALIFFIWLGLREKREYLEPAETPVEVPHPALHEKRKPERGIVSRSIIGLAMVELVEEATFLGPIPKVKRRRVIEIRGFVTSESDARALAHSVTEYAKELPI